MIASRTMAETHEADASSSGGSAETTITTPEIESTSPNDDIWASDDEHDIAAATETRFNETLLSDLPTVKRQHMTDGYREGLSIGKAKIMQNGFDAGYPIGMAIALRAGRILGCVEGIMASKDLDEDAKVAARRLLEKAKQELAIGTLLKDISDQDTMQMTSVNASIDTILSRWEQDVLDSQSEVLKSAD